MALLARRTRGRPRGDRVSARRGRGSRRARAGAGDASSAEGRAQPQVSRQSTDLTLKHLVLGALRGSFLQRCGLHLAEIVGVLPTELPVLEVRGQRSDLL